MRYFGRTKLNGCIRRTHEVPMPRVVCREIRVPRGVVQRQVRRHMMREVEYAVGCIGHRLAHRPIRPSLDPRTPVIIRPTLDPTTPVRISIVDKC